MWRPRKNQAFFFAGIALIIASAAVSLTTAFPSSIYYVVSWMAGFFGLAVIMTGLILTRVKTERHMFALPMLMTVSGVYVMLFGIFLVITVVLFWYGVALSLGGLFLLVAGILLQIRV